VAQFVRQRVPTVRALGQAEVEATLDQIGDVGRALRRADPAKLEELYGAMRLGVVYHPEEQAADVTIRAR
jgi:hypothetical protein